jgi:hypothetical protein
VAKVNLNIGAIEKAAIEAFKDSCFLLGREFTEIISEPGAFPDFPDSDIVDTGALRASQQLEFVSSTDARFTWSVDYALYVHEGYTLRNGKEQPGRPWGTEGLKRFKVQETFEALLKAKLK